jgi:hypothetical protein
VKQGIKMPSPFRQTPKGSKGMRNPAEVFNPVAILPIVAHRHADDFVLSVYFFLSGFGGAYTIATKELQIKRKPLTTDRSCDRCRRRTAGRDVRLPQHVNSPMTKTSICQDLAQRRPARMQNHGLRKYRFEQTKREKEIKRISTSSKSRHEFEFENRHP